MDELEALYLRATAQARQPGIDAETRAEIQELWKAVHSGVDTTNSAAFGTHLSAEIQRLYEETPKKERRTRLCGEGNLRCNVLHGGIPASLQHTGSRFRNGTSPITPAHARDYLARHSKCHAVRTALQTWEQKRQQTKQHLQRIIALASETGGTSVDVDESNIPG